MVQFRRRISIRWLFKKSVRNSLIILFFIGFSRFTKGAIFIDTYSFLSRPFWPGNTQKEWINSSNNLEQKIRINLLEKDNYRLREILSLQRLSEKDKISAAVISRQNKGWWQQLELNKGTNHGVEIGDSVVAPGGLIGTIDSATSTTSRVRLLTSPGSKVGVWIDRIKQHGILIGMGTNRPKLSFLDKDPDVLAGDVVSTSPASTIVPPNLPVGIVQDLDDQSTPAPFAIIQLIASPEAIDWVQILKSS